jgi:hypothetical protein
VLGALARVNLFFFLINSSAGSAHLRENLYK